MTWRRLTPSRGIDVTTSSGSHDRFGCWINGRILGRTSWVLGHVDGRRALFQIVAPYRSVRLWPWRTR